MKKIFVTGGSGFIGSAFIRLALDELPEYEIINFDALTYAGNPDNLNDVEDSRYSFIYGDIVDRDKVYKSLTEEVEIIINFAAESHVDRSIQSADKFVQTNILGTQVLLDAARHFGVKRFVQISTDEVMGSLPEDKTAFFTENSPYAPNSPYAASKAGAEHLVRAAHETFGLDTIITRCGNNYGPRQFPEKLIPLLIANALNDEPIPVYGDGRNVRDWIFVEDHCRAILAAMKQGKSGGIYNIGARNEQHNIDIVESILDALGKSRSLIQFVEDRLGHDRRYAIDSIKVETELNWKPLESWQTGLEKTINWYLKNQIWINRIRSGEYRNLPNQLSVIDLMLEEISPTFNLN
ncbi:MAG: dTDP-glucose 4,6-dehydratase [Pyrinomonadaceae bacterium]|nr:dTDP-glucose 4,6-dehydratase [Pyrinomonadaceae bacterium]